MSKHRVSVSWKRDSSDFSYESYTRDHTWVFENGLEVEASSAPSFLGNPDRVDPEQAYVASLSSCHMLTFLALAAKKRFVVDSYEDRATGVLEKNADGKHAVTRVVLRPRVVFGGERLPSVQEIDALHEGAHRHCFIANSVRTEVSVEAG